jgi:hypothetical protein
MTVSTEKCGKPRSSRFELAVVAGILLAELVLFTGSSGLFFNHDSLFYLIHAPRSWGQFFQLLSGPDPTQQYRPLTLGALSLALPFLGLDPRPYHWIPIAFHLLNTCLFFLLARRVMSDLLSALAATVFWGLHSVAAWVTYDIGYFPDFLMGFFSLSSLIVAIDGFRTRNRLRTFAALLLYAGALLCKEASVALPLALWICLVLSQLREFPRAPEGRDIAGMFRKSAPLAGIYLALALAHSARLISWLRSGLLYAQGAGAAYDINPLSNLLGKLRYFYWAFNLPDYLYIAHPNRNRALALLLMGLLLVTWLIDVARRRAKLSPVESGGLIWLIGMLAPAFLLSARTAKWYLYIPVMGLAFTIGSLAGRLRQITARINPRTAGCAILVLFLGPMLFSSAVQTRSFLNSSDSSYASLLVRNCLQDFKALHPSLPPEVTLYLLPTFQKNAAEFFGGGHLYQMFYHNSRIGMLFADKGDRLPADFRERDDIRILQFLYGHVYDVTDYYKGRRSDARSVRVIPDLDKADVTVDRSEYYPSYDSFATPNGRAVFFPTPEREIFTQIAGTTVSVPLGIIPVHAYLRFDVSWMHDQGDGAWAELSLLCGGREDLLFRKYMNPNLRGKGLTWEPKRLDLARYSGKKAELILRCRNSRGNSTVADWLNWRDTRLECPTR